MRNLLVRLVFLVFAVPVLLGSDKEGGIIGTGIVGQVTGLGQFEVSGMQFEIDQNVPTVGLDALQDVDIGMTIAVRAERQGEVWHATHIRRVHIIVGDVTSESEVMGVPVIGQIPDAKRVRVDGFWSEAGIVATRIEPVAAEEDSITGPASQIERVGKLLSSDGRSLAFDDDAIITLNGSYEDGTFIVRSSEVGLFDGSEPQLLMAEGYFSSADSNGEIRFLSTGARSNVQNVTIPGKRSKSVRCSYSGRTDFDLNQIDMPERETAFALCANLPR